MPNQVTFRSGKYAWTVSSKGTSLGPVSVGAHLAQKLRTLTEAASGQALVDAATVGGEVLRGESVKLVRKKSGNLAKAITTREVSRSRLRAAVQVGPGRQAPYGAFVEFGTGIYAEGGQGRKTPWVYPIEVNGELQFRTTRGMPAHPYLRPPILTHRTEVVKTMGASLESILRKAAT